MKPSGGQKGNQNASKREKLKNLNLEQEAFDSYCDHLSLGYASQAWHFSKGDFHLSWQTMEKYIEQFPLVFQPRKKEDAKAKAYKYWMNVLFGAAIGENTKCNIAAIQMIMRNLFGWDKREWKDEQFDARKLQPLIELFREIKPLHVVKEE
jgi:hypothetical protein